MVVSLKIVVVEDEKDMLKIIVLYLKKAGYEVKEASNGRQALDILCTERVDLLVCDWMMPQMNGLELCKEIRACSLPVKIIMLTAKSETSDEIIGLKCGADDYIKKPLEPQLLLLRIQKMFQLDSVLQCGNIKLHLESHNVFVDENEIKLTQKEWLLLRELIKNKGTTLSRNKLIELVWGTDYEGDERTLDTHIRRLRNKIGAGTITTFVGIGYRMDEENE